MLVSRVQQSDRRQDVRPIVAPWAGSRDRPVAVHQRLPAGSRVRDAQRMKRGSGGRFDESLAAEVAVREGVRGRSGLRHRPTRQRLRLERAGHDRASRPPVSSLTHSVTARGRMRCSARSMNSSRRVRNRSGDSTWRSRRRSPPASDDVIARRAEALCPDSAVGAGRSGRNELLRQAIRLKYRLSRWRTRSWDGAISSSGRGIASLARTLRDGSRPDDRLSLRERLWIHASAEDSRGRREQAVVAYEAYLAQYPEDGSARFRLAWTEMAGPRDTGTQSGGFTRFVPQSRRSAAWVNLGTAYLGSATRRMHSCLRTGVRIIPPELLGVFVNHGSGFALVKAGRVADAAATFEKMKAKADPPSLRAWQPLGRAPRHVPREVPRGDRRAASGAHHRPSVQARGSASSAIASTSCPRSRRAAWTAPRSRSGPRSTLASPSCR